MYEAVPSVMSNITVFPEYGFLKGFPTVCLGKSSEKPSKRYQNWGECDQTSWWHLALSVQWRCCGDQNKFAQNFSMEWGFNST